MDLGLVRLTNEVRLSVELGLLVGIILAERYLHRTTPNLLLEMGLLDEEVCIAATHVDGHAWDPAPCNLVLSEVEPG